MRDFERVNRLVLFPEDKRIVILDLEPVGERILSDRPFALRITFAVNHTTPPILVNIYVEWADESFVVEHRVRATEIKMGRLDVKFGQRQTLPTGRAFFALSPENLNLLTELASLGEDFYVRGYALLGLRLSGLLLAGSIIKRVLEAEEAFERNAAKSAMLRLGHCIGDSGLGIVGCV